MYRSFYTKINIHDRKGNKMVTINNVFNNSNLKCIEKKAYTPCLNINKI